MTSVLRGIIVLAAVLGAIALWGYWLWSRPAAPNESPRTARPSAVSTPARPTPLPTGARAPAGYRLAGVAVGEPQSFAVVEAPDGSHTLYHTNEDVPGLGRLVKIEAERVVVEGESGRFELRLTPAPTATPTQPSAARATPRPSPRRRAPTPRRRPPKQAGGTAPG